MSWTSTATFRRYRWPLGVLGVLAGGGGAFFLFLHLMQTNAPFAEAVAKISPDIANTFSCGCPFCNAACEPPEAEQGLARFDKMLNTQQQ